jgi:hypothetical protein
MWYNNVPSIEEETMARRRKDAPTPPPSQSVHVRLPLTVLRIVGTLADKKKQSRNTVIAEILARATKRYVKEDADAHR